MLRANGERREARAAPAAAARRRVSRREMVMIVGLLLGEGEGRPGDRPDVVAKSRNNSGRSGHHRRRRRIVQVMVRPDAGAAAARAALFEACDSPPRRSRSNRGSRPPRPNVGQIRLDLGQPAETLEQQRVMGAALMRDEARAVAAEPGHVVAAAGSAALELQNHRGPSRKSRRPRSWARSASR